jgi:hypothetical protein
MQRSPLLLISVVDISTSCKEEVEPSGALPLAAGPYEVAVNRVFPGLHRHIHMRCRASIVVRFVVVCRSNVLPSIVGGMDITPSEAV